MAVGSDLPPAYSSLHNSSVNLTLAPELVVSSSDNGANPLADSSFEHKNNKIGFIQKVLAITLLQHLATAILMVIFLFNGYAFFYQSYYRDSNQINFTVVSALAYLFTYGLMIYCDEARWKMPYKYIFLVAYPLTFGSLVGIAFYPSFLVPVLTAWIYFCVVIFALLLYSIFAFQTKIDFTVTIGLYITISVLIVTYVLVTPFIYVGAFPVLYCTLVVFLLCSYILNDIEAMVAKHYRFIITPDDYVMGALIIHIDYRYIFMKFYNSAKSTTLKFYC